MRFQTQLNLATISLVLGILAIQAAVLLYTTSESILNHYQGMAINSTILASRYVNYVVDRQEKNDGADLAEQTISWRNVVRFVARDMRVQNATIVGLNGELIATATPTLWVNHATIDGESLAKLLRSNEDSSRPALVIPGTGPTIGVVTPLNLAFEGSPCFLYLDYNVAEGRNLVRTAAVYVFALAAVGSLLAVAFSTVLSRSFAKPIQFLSQGVRRFGQGELHVRLEERGPLEVRHLARATNEMAASLQRHIDQLRNEICWRESVESELRIAAQIQEALLPKVSPTIPGMEILARSHAAKTVGGDFYDFLDYGPGKLAVAIGDATGKGLPAAILVTECSSILHALALTHLPQDLLLTQANELLVGRLGATCRFVTACVIVLDLQSGFLTFSSAGHHPPLLVRSNSGDIQELTSQNGLPLGICRETEYRPQQVRLQTGDLLLLYTDGVTEVQRDGELYGMDRLKAALGQIAALSAQQILDEIERELDFFSGSRDISDDATMICMRYAPLSVYQGSERSSLVSV